MPSLTTVFDEARLEFWKDKPELISIGDWKIQIVCQRCFGELKVDSDPVRGMRSSYFAEVEHRTKCPHCSFSQSYLKDGRYYSCCPYIVIRSRFITTNTSGWGPFIKHDGFFEKQELSKGQAYLK